jgi:hypothetical protein
MVYNITDHEIEWNGESYVGAKEAKEEAEEQDKVKN